MKVLPLLCLALLLAACGEPASSAQAPGAAGVSNPPPAALVVRAEPFAVGDVAPAFAGLPAEGKTIVVFYRGPW